MKVGIIGGGPRGLWAAEALIARARERRAKVSVEVWDDRHFGAGSAYASKQPACWRLNVDSSIIRTRSTTFDDWRRERGEAEPLDPFPPRALVGQFFAGAWDPLLVLHAVDEVRERATRIEAEGRRWRVVGGSASRLYDEVLLATGHASDWEGALSHRDLPVPLVPQVTMHHLDKVPAGSTVAIRGAALTFIDAALGLTEARGGRFLPTDGGGLRYEASGREPATLWPTSRGGRFMEAKPQPGSPLTKVADEELVASGSRAIAEAADLAGVQAALISAAKELQRRTGGGGDVLDVFDGEDSSGDPVEDLRRSYTAAVGARRPGAAWAVGEAWRRLYPALVERVSFGGRETLDGFDDLARRMERLAFGPPPVNVAKLLALLEAGIVDPAHLKSFDRALADADWAVDAVIAPPGVHPGTLVGRLVEEGVLRQYPESRSVAILPDGSAVGAKHLAVVGRATEDVTLGNDTLSRSLHDVVERWAERVVDRA